MFLEVECVPAMLTLNVGFPLYEQELHTCRLMAEGFLFIFVYNHYICRYGPLLSYTCNTFNKTGK